jgi:4'-phosphopantetheinyl transferase
MSTTEVTMSSTHCQVWWARPSIESPRLLALLDPVELDRHAAYQRTVDQVRFLTARVVAKVLAARAMGVKPDQVTLDSTCPDCGRKHGKPKVVAPPGEPVPELSISHSGGLVAVAVTDGVPVGVDVEQERDVQVEDLIRLTLSPAEQDAFATVADADRDAAFFTYWARKEAILKATGRGLAIPMTKVTITHWDQPPRILDSQSSEVDPTAMTLAHLTPGTGYRACVAILAKLPAGDWVTEHDADPLVAELA